MVGPVARHKHGRHSHIATEILDAADEKKRNDETADRLPVEGAAENEFAPVGTFRNLRSDRKHNGGSSHGGNRDGRRCRR